MWRPMETRMLEYSSSFIWILIFLDFHIQLHLIEKSILSLFWPRVYPSGSFSNHPCGPSLRPCVYVPVFKYLNDGLLFFSKFSMKSEINKVKKVTRPEFWKKNLICRLRGIKCQKCGFWGIFSETAHLKFHLKLESNRAHRLSIVVYFGKILICD